MRNMRMLIWSVFKEEASPEEKTGTKEREGIMAPGPGMLRNLFHFQRFRLPLRLLFERRISPSVLNKSGTVYRYLVARRP